MKIELKNLKGFPKLAIQIALLSASMMALSFITETEFWLDYFCFKVDAGSCSYADHMSHNEYPKHYHWNYRGWIYFLTGLVYFGVSVAKIITSHKEKDFLNN